MKCVFPMNWPSDQDDTQHRETYPAAGCKTTLAGALDRIDRALNARDQALAELKAT